MKFRHWMGKVKNRRILIFLLCPENDRKSAKVFHKGMIWHTRTTQPIQFIYSSLPQMFLYHGWLTFIINVTWLPNWMFLSCVTPGIVKWLGQRLPLQVVFRNNQAKELKSQIHGRGLISQWRRRQILTMEKCAKDMSM